MPCCRKIPYFAALANSCQCPFYFFPPLLNFSPLLVWKLLAFGLQLYMKLFSQLLDKEGVKARNIRRMALESITTNIFEGCWKTVLATSCVEPLQPMIDKPACLLEPWYGSEPSDNCPTDMNSCDLWEEKEASSFIPPFCSPGLSLLIH